MYKIKTKTQDNNKIETQEIAMMLICFIIHTFMNTAYSSAKDFAKIMLCSQKIL